MKKGFNARERTTARVHRATRDGRYSWGIFLTVSLREAPRVFGAERKLMLHCLDPVGGVGHPLQGRRQA
jgi:hypothetical protein